MRSSLPALSFSYIEEDIVKAPLRGLNLSYIVFENLRRMLAAKGNSPPSLSCPESHGVPESGHAVVRVVICRLPAFYRIFMRLHGFTVHDSTVTRTSLDSRPLDNHAGDLDPTYVLLSELLPTRGSSRFRPPLGI